MASSTNDTDATLSLRILSQLPEPHANIMLDGISKQATILDVKSHIQQQIPSKPPPGQQRLIYRGRALTRDTDTLERVFGALVNQTGAVHNIHLVVRDTGRSTPQPRTAPGQPTAPQAQPPQHAHMNGASFTRVVVHGPTVTTSFGPDPGPAAPNPQGIHLPMLRPLPGDSHDAQSRLQALNHTMDMSRQILRQTLANQPQEIREYSDRLLANPQTSNVDVPSGIAPGVLAHVQHHTMLIRQGSEVQRSLLETHPELRESQSTQTQPSGAEPRSEPTPTPTQPVPPHHEQLAQIHNQHHQQALRMHAAHGAGPSGVMWPMPHNTGVPFSIPSPFLGPNLNPLHSLQNPLLQRGASRGAPPTNLHHPIESMRRHQSDLDMLRLRLQRFLDSQSSHAPIPRITATSLIDHGRSELTSLIFSRNHGQRVINTAITQTDCRLPSHGTLSQEDIAVLRAFQAQFKAQAVSVEGLISELERRRSAEGGASTDSRAGGAEHGSSNAGQATASNENAPNMYTLIPPDAGQPLLVTDSPHLASDRTEVLNVEVARANQAIAAMNEQMAHANRSIAAANSAVAAMNRAVSLARPEQRSAGRNGRDALRLQRDVRATQELAQAWAQGQNADAPAPALHEAGRGAQGVLPNAQVRVDRMQLLLPLFRHLWLLARIFAFILFFSGGGGSWRRIFFLGLAAGLYLVMQTDMMRGLREVVHRHFQTLLGPQRRDDQAGAANGQAAGGAAPDAPQGPAGAGGTARDDAAAPNPQAGGVSPEVLAQRLLRERRERDRGWLREHLRGAERLVALFFATLYPGLQVVVRDRQQEVAVEAAVAQQAQAAEAVDAAQAAADPAANATSANAAAAAPTADSGTAAADAGNEENPGPLFVPATTNAHTDKAQSEQSATAEASSSAIDMRGEGASGTRQRAQAGHSNNTEQQGNDDGQD